ncbi:MAG: type VI secretion system contractile sheath large subunit [Acetobacteraceae bacterium]|nr:type VI secretion system contractile sheath large subunit [Acetobacteraceae bacterium]
MSSVLDEAAVAPENAGDRIVADSERFARPLREAALAGHFFGAKHRTSASAMSDALAASPGAFAAEWFGAAIAADLIRQPSRLRATVDRDIAAIDNLLSDQVDAILHAARLRRLEGRWRGLHWLLTGIDPSPRVKVKVLNLSWPELCRDLERAPDFDQSNLFRRVYEDEFGMPGGEPIGLLVIDHELRHAPAPGASTDDVLALSSLAAVAAAAFAPTILSASPALLGTDRFADLAASADPAAPIRAPDHARWRSIASREDARFLSVVLPRVLARPPWADDPARIDGFRYAEYAPEAEDRCWMSAGFPFAANVVRAFVDHAWPADIRGVETGRRGGGAVFDLPEEPFRTDPDHIWCRASLDLVLTDRQEQSLVEAGLIPLSALRFGTEAVFSTVRSLQAPAQFVGTDAAAARANARISSQTNSMLCVSRFAHYVKVLGRDMVGSFRTAEEIERVLQSWLAGYVNTSVNAGPDTRAKYPLVAGRVSVSERPGRPGAFGCVIHLQPHFQLDDVSATFRLVTEITAPGAR